MVGFYLRVSREQGREGVLLTGGRCVTAFISHRFASAGPDLSHEGREVPDVSWSCLPSL